MNNDLISWQLINNISSINVILLLIHHFPFILLDTTNHEIY